MATSCSFFGKSFEVSRERNTRHFQSCIVRGKFVSCLWRSPVPLEIIPRFFMKYCPACNSSFPDFQHVCDVDGTGLVSDPRRLALIKLPGRQPSVRRLMTSPKTLTALAILGLFLTAAIIGYQQMISRSTRTLLAANVATPSLETSPTPSNRELRTSSPPTVAQSNLAEKAPTRARRSSAGRLVVKSRREKGTEHPSPRTEVAHRSESVPPERQPKVVAMLKTTWRVLKRPFSF